jgi:hypothetical protein
MGPSTLAPEMLMALLTMIALRSAAEGAIPGPDPG